MTCVYVPEMGMMVNFPITKDHGFSFILPEYWTVATIARYLHELASFYS